MRITLESAYMGLMTDPILFRIYYGWRSTIRENVNFLSKDRGKDYMLVDYSGVYNERVDFSTEVCLYVIDYPGYKDEDT